MCTFPDQATRLRFQQRHLHTNNRDQTGPTMCPLTRRQAMSLGRHGIPRQQASSKMMVGPAQSQLPQTALLMTASTRLQVARVAVAVLVVAVVEMVNSVVVADVVVTSADVAMASSVVVAASVVPAAMASREEAVEDVVVEDLVEVQREPHLPALRKSNGHE